MESPNNVLVNGLVLTKLFNLFELLQSINSIDLVEELVVLRLVRGQSLQVKLWKVLCNSEFVFEQVSVNADFWMVSLAAFLLEYLC